MTRLPPTASVALLGSGAKLHAPSAARNAPAICELLAVHASARGQALELASGTGEHVTVFARALPGLRWQPTEIDAARRASIDAHAAEAGLANIAPARALDACVAGWGGRQSACDVIVLINLLHLIPTPAARTVVIETAAALAPGGLFLLYGPFRRSGRLTNPGDETFDAELRAANPEIGYKNDLDILHWLGEAGLAAQEPVDMPANNLAFLSRKSPTCA